MVFLLFIEAESNQDTHETEQERQRYRPLRGIRIEEYGAAKGMTGEQVLDLFSQYGVTDYLSECFEPLHTQGRQWLIEEIDEFIGIRKNKKA